MGSCISNTGSFEPPGSQALAAFVAERERETAPTLVATMAAELATERAKKAVAVGQVPAAPAKPEKPKSIPTSDVHTTASTSTPVASRTEFKKSPIDEKMQTELLSRLYDLDIPATDIALVVNAMRGKCTREEEAQLLQRLYSFHVPSAAIAQMVDAMRSCEGSSRGEVSRDEPIRDAPPGYDSKF